MAPWPVFSAAQPVPSPMWTGKLGSSATQGCYTSAPPCHQQGCECRSTRVGAGAKSYISIPPSPAPCHLPRLDITGGHMDHQDHCNVCRRKLGPEQPQPTSSIFHLCPATPISVWACGAQWLRVWNPSSGLGPHLTRRHPTHTMPFRPASGLAGLGGACFFNSSWW